MRIASQSSQRKAAGLRELVTVWASWVAMGASADADRSGEGVEIGARRGPKGLNGAEARGLEDGSDFAWWDWGSR